MSRVTVRLHQHHQCASPFEASAEPLAQRVAFIREYKAPSEVPTRERLMRDVEIDVPEPLAAAFERCSKAAAKYERRCHEYDQVGWSDMDDTRGKALIKCRQAGEVHSQAFVASVALARQHLPLLVELHDKLCVQPQRAAGYQCPWTPEHPSIF